MPAKSSLNGFIEQLPNALTISYSRYGDPNGTPAFYFHGLPGSRYEAEYLRAACEKYGINLIAPDRFGYGQSSAVRQNRYLRWVECIEQLADRLGFGKFYLFAASGGSPYANACASKLKQRVRATGIYCGLGSLAIPELRKQMQGFSQLACLLAKYAPWLLSLSYGLPIGIASRYFGSFATYALSMINGEPDKSTILRQDVRSQLIRSFRVAFNQLARGGVDDLVAANQPWPFDLACISPLYLWHGDQDPVVPHSHSLWLQQQVPAATLEIVKGEGHFSLPFGYPERLVKTVTAVD